MTDTSFLTELLSASGDLAYDWDLDADHITWYGAWTKVFGEAGALPTSSAAFYRVIHDDDRHLVFGTEASAIDREYRLRRPDGQIVWVHERGLAEFREGHLLKQRGLLRLIEKRTEHHVTRDWHGRDELTDCLNRNDMLIHLGKAIEVARATKRGCAYLVVGIDKMSFVNEAVGMEAGDGLLRGVAERLSEILPPRAQLARVAGDMFGILLTDTLARDFPV